jgi:hypothetical protein
MSADLFEELRQAARDLRALAPESALADLVEAKIEQMTAESEQTDRADRLSGGSPSLLPSGRSSPFWRGSSLPDTLEPPRRSCASSSLRPAWRCCMCTKRMNAGSLGFRNDPQSQSSRLSVQALRPDDPNSLAEINDVPFPVKGQMLVELGHYVVLTRAERLHQLREHRDLLQACLDETILRMGDVLFEPEHPGS